MGLSKIILPTIAILLLGGYSTGWEIDSARERPCFVPRRTVPLNMDWVHSIDTLYYPAMSMMELYRVAEDMTGQQPEDLSETTVNSCFYFRILHNGTLTSNGFGGQSKEYTIIYDSPDKFEFIGEGYSGMAYVTLTDNRTFFFTPICTDEGEMAWGLASTVPQLPERTMKRVYDHAISLGFKREFFVNLNYDKCDIGGDTQSTTSMPTTAPPSIRKRKTPGKFRGGWNARRQY